MSAAPQPRLPSRMTVDEFRLWDAPGPGRWELVAGEPVAMAPASDTHGAIQAEIIRLFGNHLVEAGRDCRVIDQLGIIPRVGAMDNFRIPDLSVVCGGNPGENIPVLLVEILSPSNEMQTRANVWTYTTIPSVTEILMVRVSRMEAELLRRAPDGVWPERPSVHKGADLLTLDSIGLTIRLDQFYRTSGLRL